MAQGRKAAPPRLFKYLIDRAMPETKGFLTATPCCCISCILWNSRQLASAQGKVRDGLKKE